MEAVRNFLVDDAVYLTWGIALLEVIVTVLLFIDHHKKHEPIILCMALLGVGLCFDAIVIGFGGMILPPILPLLSRVRFVLHGLLIPLNLVICGYSIPMYPRPQRVVWVLTVLIMLAGAASGVFRQIDMAAPIGDIVRFVSVSPKSDWTEMVNTALTFGTMIPLILTGFVVLFKQKSPSILLAGVLMFAFTAVAPATGNVDLLFLTSMLGELCMLFFYMVFEKRHTTI